MNWLLENWQLSLFVAGMATVRLFGNGQHRRSEQRKQRLCSYAGADGNNLDHVAFNRTRLWCRIWRPSPMPGAGRAFACESGRTRPALKCSCMDAE
jgi:hypothetical protein